MIVKRIKGAVKSGRDRTIEMLCRLVGENSFSGNPEGLNRVGDLVLANLPRSLDVHFETDPNGVRHHIVQGPAVRGKGILLLGHLDTVFPREDHRNPFLLEGKRIRGQGTADMKGGIVVMVQALRVLDGLGLLEKIPLFCIFSGDEEVGSPFSERLIRGAAGKARWGLVFECGGQKSEIVTARRGVARFELTVRGKAGHAGRIGGARASAIAALAREVLDLEELSDLQRGISLNVGTITGGQATNIVPERACARFEIRFWNDTEENCACEKIETIVSRADITGCVSSLRRFERRPGLEAVPGTGELVGFARECGAALGQKIGTEKRGGASDGNFLSDMGVPVIDGLGPVGDLDHSPEEYILAESLFERIALTALLLARLAGVGVH